MLNDKHGQLRKAVDNTYVFWALLATPAVYLLTQRFVLHGKVPFVPLSGDIAGWLLIVTMSVTPLMMMFGPLPWLKARRRNLGVASFGYALLHLVIWLGGANVGSLLRSFVRVEILAGWIAFALMVLLAVTSNEKSVRKLGVRWKTLQRWVYAAAILSLVHWVMTTDNLSAVAIYTAPLVALSVWRIWRHRQRVGQV